MTAGLQLLGGVLALGGICVACLIFLLAKAVADWMRR